MTRAGGGRERVLRRREAQRGGGLLGELKPLRRSRRIRVLGQGARDASCLPASRRCLLPRPSRIRGARQFQAADPNPGQTGAGCLLDVVLQLDLTEGVEILRFSFYRQRREFMYFDIPG